MRVTIYILFSLFALTSCQKFTWNNPYDIATPKSVFTPDGLAVRQEGENLLLSWSQENSNISGFKLFRSIDRGVSTELVTLNKTTLSYTDANIQGGKTYTYSLKAYADKNESNEVSTEIVAKSRPTINTIAASAITENTATSGGAIVSDGGSPITSKGLVWSTSVNPTIDLTTKTNDGNGSSAFERILTNLSPNTIYYVRAYATNSVGTAYGNQIIFTTGKPPSPPILESLSQGLVAYYPFNGNANDESGNSNNAADYNVILTKDRFGNVNSAFKFNGIESSSSSQVNFVNPIFNIGQNAYSIHMFFKPDNLTQVTRCLFNTIPHTGIGVAFNDNNAPGYVVYDIGPANAFWTNLYMRGTKNNYQAGTWYSFTLVKSGINYSFYINGVLEHTYSNPSASSYNFNVGFRISGISEPNSGTQTFAGDLDDFRLYSRALTQEEITYLANN